MRVTMSETRSFTCNLCEAMCGLRVGVEGDRVVSVRGDDDDVLSRGHVCPKAHGLRELFEDRDRVRAPSPRAALHALREASGRATMESSHAPWVRSSGKCRRKRLRAAQA